MSISGWPFFVVFLVCLGCRPDSGTEGRETAAAPASKEVVYVDVRTPEEVAAGHVVGALHIPYDQMEERWQELDSLRERPIVLYCRTGRRSGIAEDILRARGFTNIENGGGLAELEKQGIPTTQ